jgi:O-antigen ligase
LWAAALLDVGIVGLSLWLALLGTALALVLRTTWARPSVVTAALTMAMVAALCSTLVANDRLDLRVWMLIGLAAAVAVRDPIGVRR